MDELEHSKLHLNKCAGQRDYVSCSIVICKRYNGIENLFSVDLLYNQTDKTFFFGLQAKKKLTCGVDKTLRCCYKAGMSSLEEMKASRT